MYISSIFKSQLSFNWHLNSSKVYATQSWILTTGCKIVPHCLSTPLIISKFKFDNRPFSMANDNISSLWRLSVSSYHHEGLKTAKLRISAQLWLLKLGYQLNCDYLNWNIGSTMTLKIGISDKTVTINLGYQLNWQLKLRYRLNKDYQSLDWVLQTSIKFNFQINQKC
jgi:hypothetical protein